MSTGGERQGIEVASIARGSEGNGVGNGRREVAVSSNGPGGERTAGATGRCFAHVGW